VSDFVTVFETGDPAAIALAKSLLDSAGIEFDAKGENVQDLFGVGRFPGGTNLVTGPVTFQVRAEDAARAKSLLSDLEGD
jgi:putative signal transducing protein